MSAATSSACRSPQAKITLSFAASVTWEYSSLSHLLGCLLELGSLKGFAGPVLKVAGLHEQFHPNVDTNSLESITTTQRQACLLCDLRWLGNRIRLSSRIRRYRRSTSSRYVLTYPVEIAMREHRLDLSCYVSCGEHTMSCEVKLGAQLHLTHKSWIPSPCLSCCLFSCATLTVHSFSLAFTEICIFC